MASRGWLHMLQAMMRVLKVRSTGSTPCSRYHEVGSGQAGTTGVLASFCTVHNLQLQARQVDNSQT